jgi:hypothetical protein
METDQSQDVRKELRKAALKLTGDYQSQKSQAHSNAFLSLEELVITGEVGNIATFLKHLRSALVSLVLNIDDPADNYDWQDLCVVISERFSDSLRSLRITANSYARPEFVRINSKGEGLPNRQSLSLKHLSNLPELTLFDIDLPYSVLFDADDIQNLATACPSAEVIRLCPTARFPLASGPPSLRLSDLTPLTTACQRLHSLSVVVNAEEATDVPLASRDASSLSLRQLHVGHSWIKDPLETAILLSHLAPCVETLRYFHEPTRPGYIPAHASAWLKVTEILPHLQRIRLSERQAAEELLASRTPTLSYVEAEPPRRPTVTIGQKSMKSARSVLESILESPAQVDDDSSIFVYPSNPPAHESQSEVFIYGPQTPIYYLPQQLPFAPTMARQLSAPREVFPPPLPPVVKADAAIDATIPEVEPVVRDVRESWIQVEPPSKFYSTISTSVTDLAPPELPPPPPPIRVESFVQAVPQTASVSTAAFVEVASISIEARPTMANAGIDNPDDFIPKPLPPPSVDTSVQAVPQMASAAIEALVNVVSTAVDATPQVFEKAVDHSFVEAQKVDAEVTATPAVVERAIEHIPSVADKAVAHAPSLVDKASSHAPSLAEKEVSATFENEEKLAAPVPVHPRSSDARLPWPRARERTMSTSTDATAVEPEWQPLPPTLKGSKQARRPLVASTSPPPQRHKLQDKAEPSKSTTTTTTSTSYLPSVGGVFGAARDVLVVYPTYLSLLAVHTALGMMGAQEPQGNGNPAFSELGISPLCQ